MFFLAGKKKYYIGMTNVNNCELVLLKYCSVSSYSFILVIRKWKIRDFAIIRVFSKDKMAK
jgi:hypothetical protein